MYIIPCCVHGSFVLSAYCFTCREQTLNQRHLPICLLAADAIKEEIFLHPSRAQSTTGVSPFVLLLHNCWWSGGYDKSQSNPFFSSYYCCCFCSLLLPHMSVPRDNMTCIAQHIPVILNKSLTDGIRLAHLSVFILKLWTADIADSILI